MSLKAEGAAGRRQEAARRWLRRLEAREKRVGEALLLVVAHPDDEVVGVGGQLARLMGVRLLHVTDGAPRNLLDAQAAGSIIGRTMPRRAAQSCSPRSGSQASMRRRQVSSAYPTRGLRFG
jgi:hypothetical protein